MDIHSPIRWRKAMVFGGVITAAGFAALWVTSRPIENAAPNQLPVISCSSMDYVEQLDKQPRKLRAGPEVGGMGMFQYEISYPPPPFEGDSKGEIVHPNIAVEAFGGWLLGADRGEFGGELVFQTGEPPSSSQVVVYENIEDIYKMPYGFIATSGIAHMSVNSGAILLIEQTKNGSVTAKVLFKLPGAPRSSWPLKSNDILINTDAGSFIATKHRELNPVECKEGTEDGI